MRGLRSLCLVALLSTIGTIGLAIAPRKIAGIRSANAYANGVTFNVLGGVNGAGWGNTGGLESVSFLRDKIWQYAYSTGDWPTTVATQETCTDLDPNTLDQYAFLIGQLVFTVGNYVTDQYMSSAAACPQNGLTVFGRADGTWGDPWVTRYVYGNQVPGHARKLLCIRPSLWVLNYVSCSTHLENNFISTVDDVAHLQLGELNNFVHDYSVFTGVQAGGDFNISIQCNWPYPASTCGSNYLSSNLVTWFNFNGATNHWEAGVSPYSVTYPTQGSDIPEKLDHFGRSAPFQYLASPSRFRGMGSSGNYVSDHWMLRVYIG